MMCQNKNTYDIFMFNFQDSENGSVLSYLDEESPTVSMCVCVCVCVCVFFASEIMKLIINNRFALSKTSYRFNEGYDFERMSLIS